MVHVNNCCYFAGYLLKFDHGNDTCMYLLPEQMFLLRVLFGSFVDLEGGISGGCRTGNRFKEGVFAAAGNEDLVFGGGTPSYLEHGDLERIIRKLEENYLFATGMERTIELNPEDLVPEKLQGIKDLGFNRLSIGVQSFFG